MSIKLLLQLSFISLLFNACHRNTMVLAPHYLQRVVDQNQLNLVKGNFDRFCQQSIGHFQYQEQELLVIPICENRPGEFWVYQEAFTQGKSIEQQICQYIRVEKNLYRLEYYDLRSAAPLQYAWNKTTLLQDLTPQDFIRRENKDLFVLRNEGKAYQYQTMLVESSMMKNQINTVQDLRLEKNFTIDDNGYSFNLKYYDSLGTLVNEEQQSFTKLNSSKPSYAQLY